MASAAMLHLAASNPTIGSEHYLADILGTLYHKTDLLKKPLKLGPQTARVPYSKTVVNFAVLTTVVRSLLADLYVVRVLMQRRRPGGSPRRRVSHVPQE